MVGVLELMNQQRDYEKSQILEENEESEIEKNPVSLDMRNQWYPMFRSCDLLPNKPYAEHILGDPVVFFRDENGKVVCLEDKCAHRSAPLSIGSIKNGKIECKYHGWQYDCKGKVVEIPALMKERSIPANAKTQAYPCAELEGLVWVWPGDPSIADESLIFRGRPYDEKDASGWTEFVFTEDLDIDHSLMVENLLDPAHLPFTHDGTISKRADATSLTMSLYPVKEGFGGKVSSGNNRFKSHFNFIAPCHIFLNAKIKDNWQFMQVMHCVPTSPGNMKLVYRQYRNFFVFVDKIPGLYSYQHKMSRKVVYQDYELLHGQQERLDQGARPWNSPIQVDRLPKVYRNWLNKALQLKPYFKGYSRDIKEGYDPAVPRQIPSNNGHGNSNVDLSTNWSSKFFISALPSVLAIAAIILVVTKQ